MDSHRTQTRTSLDLRDESIRAMVWLWSTCGGPVKTFSKREREQKPARDLRHVLAPDRSKKQKVSPVGGSNP